MDAGHLLTPSWHCGGEGEGENSKADKGSEEQLSTGERRAISAFRSCFLRLKLLSPSHTEGETTICLCVASLYFEVLEAGPQHETLVAPPADPGDGDENRAALAHRRVLGAPASREREYDRTVQSNRYV